jgi:hypothetical protein
MVDPARARGSGAGILPALGPWPHDP